MPGTTRDVSDSDEWQNEWLLRNGTPCDGVLKLYTSKAGFRQVLFCRKRRHRDNYKRRRNRSHHAASVGRPRLRTRLMPTSYLEAGFINGERVTGSTVLGKVTKWNSSGVQTSVVNITRTGQLADASNLEKCWDATHPGPPYRSGGIFCLVKTKIPHSKVYGPVTLSSKGNPDMSGQALDQYRGYITDGSTNWTGDSLTEYSVPTVPSLEGYDTLAWDRTKPTIPKLNLTQSLYELRDLPRMLESTANSFHNLWQQFNRGGYLTTMMKPKAASDQFLNVQFGWIPFLDDYFKFTDLIENFRQYELQTIRSNNTWQKRRRVLESDLKYTTLAVNPGTATEPQSTDSRFSKILRIDGTTGGLPYRGTHTIELKELKRVWAVGSFKYYRPEFDRVITRDSSLEFATITRLRRLATLAGLRINPSTLYKITPWTWAADWFTSMGNHIQRYDDFITDGLVSKYLYVMKTTERRVRKTSVMNAWSGSCTFMWERSLVKKQRKAADSPYGFDRPWNSLSPRQLLILGAVGITQSNSGFISRG